jgi:hypothetical protein
VIVDCETCVVRGPACGDCVVTFLLGPPDWLAVDGLPHEEAAALAVLADSGLVPPLRLVAPLTDDGSPAVRPGLPPGRAVV